MRTTSFLASLFILSMAAGCNKEKENEQKGPDLPVFDNKTIITEVFTAGMSSISMAQKRKYRSTINFPVENYFHGPEGGYIHVLGSITGSITIDDHMVNIQITIIINSSGSGGHVSGAIDGQGVDYTI